jgi:hypothetical protein|uniref:Lipoprotein n=1 Tax=Myoviridae sp. ct78050 TaxID=2826617 RepID=A0A8S5R0K8_9CAUD|nr:MAG TPA: protein of unknown function (DUF5052) [Myoviridae sp. ct78050]
MNKLTKLLLSGAIVFSLVGCASLDRFGTDVKSDLSGGLNRVINVYTADGKLLRTFEGKIDLGTNDGGYVKFDYKGKRYVYYNCFVETIAEK